MDAYCEITLLHNPEIGRNFLWSKVYQQIHLGLVPLLDADGRSPIGVAFPDYGLDKGKPSLGGRCRLFAPNDTLLMQFDPSRCLARLSDYVHCTSIRPVPSTVGGYATFQRLQPKINPERLARRYAKRHDMEVEAALGAVIEVAPPEMGKATYKTAFRYREMPTKAPPEPFIRLKSLSGGREFCLWVRKTTRSEPVAGHFTSYGLSSTTTVPDF